MLTTPPTTTDSNGTFCRHYLFNICTDLYSIYFISTLTFMQMSILAFRTIFSVNKTISFCDSQTIYYCNPSPQ